MLGPEAHLRKYLTVHTSEEGNAGATPSPGEMGGRLPFRRAFMLAHAQAKQQASGFIDLRHTEPLTHTLTHTLRVFDALSLHSHQLVTFR